MWADFFPVIEQPPSCYKSPRRVGQSLRELGLRGYGAMTQPKNIFSGLKVLDLASFIAGPAATTILSDFGATVTKVEQPGTGDPYRYFYATPPNPISEHNYAWQLTNRNKRSISLDLKHPDTCEVLQRLVKWADVFVTNFPPRVKKSLGIGYETLAAINPRLVYADVTGYGALGAEADRPGFDITAYWARTGLMHMAHDEGSPPPPPHARHRRPHDGDHALFGDRDGTLPARKNRPRQPRFHFAHRPGCLGCGSLDRGRALRGEVLRTEQPQETFQCALEYLSNIRRPMAGLGSRAGKGLGGLVSAIKCPELLNDRRFSDGRQRTQNAPALVGILDSVFESHPLSYWKHTLESVGVIFGVVQNTQEIISDPQLLANGIFAALDLPGYPAKYTVSSPIHVAGVDKTAARRAPTLGEHSTEILEELGLSDEDVAALLASGAVMGA